MFLDKQLGRDESVNGRSKIDNGPAGGNRQHQPDHPEGETNGAHRKEENRLSGNDINHSVPLLLPREWVVRATVDYHG